MLGGLLDLVSFYRVENFLSIENRSEGLGRSVLPWKRNFDNIYRGSPCELSVYYISNVSTAN